MTQYQFSEKEFIEKTGFKPEKKYRKRQDWLAAAFVHTTKMPEDQWQSLPEQIFEWSNKAADVFRHNKENPQNLQLIPDFVEDEHDAESTSDHSAREANDSGDASINDGSTALEGQEAGNEDAGGVGNEDKATTKAPKKQVTVKKVKAAKPKKEKGPGRKLNEWGVQMPSKSHEACMMAARPEGTTQKEIMEKLRQTHYNLFQRIEKNGHTVKRNGGRVWLVSKNKHETAAQET